MRDRRSSTDLELGRVLIRAKRRRTPPWSRRQRLPKL
ncbi:hypothetical protein CASFOL_024341 [Castilleja foliolosa]|uniref:Ribosomal protein S12 n=1 Tax=Castilleja foliolosa TaxID=1961234 RepID=A0ABD3CPF2_9LAMI